LANCFSADSKGLADSFDHAAMSAHHAPPRKGHPPKENANPQSGNYQSGKHKQPGETDQLKLLQDLKSEAGNFQAAVQFIMNHITNDSASCAKLQKFGNSGKPPKAQASLASAQQGKG
jgi:hypothetical protein